MIKIDWDFSMPKNYNNKTPNETSSLYMVIIAKALPIIFVFWIFNKYMKNKLTIE